jgi:hypothetical protein
MEHVTLYPQSNNEAINTSSPQPDIFDQVLAMAGLVYVDDSRQAPRNWAPHANPDARPPVPPGPYEQPEQRPPAPQPGTKDSQ